MAKTKKRKADSNLGPESPRMGGGHVTDREWLKFAAFAVNKRGILTHRVRSVRTYFYGGVAHHCAAKCWCGHSFCFELRDAAEVITSDPPRKRLLCVQCDAKAMAKGKKSADAVAGRHVHKGVLRAYQVCCNHGK